MQTVGSRCKKTELQGNMVQSYSLAKGTEGACTVCTESFPKESLLNQIYTRIKSNEGDFLIKVIFNLNCG